GPERERQKALAGPPGSGSAEARIGGSDRSPGAGGGVDIVPPAQSGCGEFILPSAGKWSKSIRRLPAAAPKHTTGWDVTPGPLPHRRQMAARATGSGLSKLTRSMDDHRGCPT